MPPWWDWEMGVLAVGGGLIGAGALCGVRGLASGRSAMDVRRLLPLAGISRERYVRVAVAVAAGAVIGLVTGWPVGAVLAAAAGWWLPSLLGADTEARRQADLAEALATWAEQLRDMLTGAAGLHQAVSATVPAVPVVIAKKVRAFEARLRAGQPVERAAAEFAREVDCDLADLVSITLTMGASQYGGDVAGALSRLAQTARERAVTVARVSASRARVRSSVRIIAGATLLMVVGTAAFQPAVLEPLGTPTGQLVLALTGAIWAASFAWMARLAAPPAVVRPFTLVAADGGGR
ncbi:type II secretion system F family protein [Nocardiopsis protaetiae]|uniref:type II secretion system F family protein n=1 Tax=Nocardiopsis protaetiae TaxID=3382270 RepID=UPI00387B1ACF